MALMLFVMFLVVFVFVFDSRLVMVVFVFSVFAFFLQSFSFVIVLVALQRRTQMVGTTRTSRGNIHTTNEALTSTTAISTSGRSELTGVVLWRSASSAVVELLLISEKPQQTRRVQLLIQFKMAPNAVVLTFGVLT